MKLATIFIEDSFDSAHCLPNVPDDHKCRRMHGHTYRIRIEVTGPIDPIMGWVIDYTEIKAAWLPVKERLDHRTLNDILFNPTCELIASWISERLALKGDAFVSQIELSETEHCGAVWIR